MANEGCGSSSLLVYGRTKPSQGVEYDLGELEQLIFPSNIVDGTGLGSITKKVNLLLNQSHQKM